MFAFKFETFNYCKCVALNYNILTGAPAISGGKLGLFLNSNNFNPTPQHASPKRQVKSPVISGIFHAFLSLIKVVVLILLEHIALSRKTFYSMQLLNFRAEDIVTNDRHETNIINNS